MREAGVAYEKLAGVRFATEHYPDDIWNSADCFYRGQSYSSTTRLLDLYLKNEPEKRNAESAAQARASESDARQRRPMHRRRSKNASSSIRATTRPTKRESIVRKPFLTAARPRKPNGCYATILSESNLKPSSPEWRDSLFALGRMLFYQGHNEDAINTLEEAVERYPDDRQSLQARYLIGESYRRWADEPLERLQQARTATEREKGTNWFTSA